MNSIIMKCVTIILPSEIYSKNQCNPSYQQTQRKKSYDHINRFRNCIWYNITSHDKNCHQTKNGNFLNVIINIPKKPMVTSCLRRN